MICASIAVEEILELGNRLKQQKIRVKEVIRDVDEEDAEFDEETSPLVYGPIRKQRWIYSEVARACRWFIAEPNWAIPLNIGFVRI